MRSDEGKLVMLAISPRPTGEQLYHEPGFFRLELMVREIAEEEDIAKLLEESSVGSYILKSKVCKDPRHHHQLAIDLREAYESKEPIFLGKDMSIVRFGDADLAEMILEDCFLSDQESKSYGNMELMHYPAKAHQRTRVK